MLEINSLNPTWILCVLRGNEPGYEDSGMPCNITFCFISGGGGGGGGYICTLPLCVCAPVRVCVHVCACFTLETSLIIHSW